MTTQELKEYINKTLGNSIRCLLPSYWWKRLFGLVVDEVEVISENINKLLTRVDTIENKKFIIDITYEELVKLTNSKKLIPGQSYRITDYECTVNNNDDNISVNPYSPDSSQSFKIVVTALTNDSLSENAKATHPEQLISYEMGSWELKYTIDNYRFSWGESGEVDYNVYIYFTVSTWLVHMGFYWDENKGKYISDEDTASYLFLSKSATDNSPLQKTEFTIGDNIYVNYGNDIIETKVQYHSNMKDTGEGVLVKNITINDNLSVVPFVWDSVENGYTIPKDISNDFVYLLCDNTYSPIEKRDFFVKGEKFKIKHFKKKFIPLTIVSDYDIVVGIINNSNPHPKGNAFIWDSEQNKYVNVLDPATYLGISSNDNTPLPKKEFNVNEPVSIYWSKGGYTQEHVLLTKNNSDNKLLFSGYYNNEVTIIFKWDETKNCYYADVYNFSLIFEDNTYVPKDYSFTSDIVYGVIDISNEENESDIWKAIGFYIPKGKGVVYYLKDGNGNEAPYDFKNILFKISDDDIFKYTFHASHSNSNSLESSSHVHGIKIERSFNSFGIQRLNKISIGPCTNANVFDIPRNIVISGKVYNQYIDRPGSDIYIGINDDGKLSKVNIANLF